MLARQAQGQPNIMFPRSPALPHRPHRTARSILAKPPPERPYPHPPRLGPTDDIQVLPHHALGVRAQENVEIQDPTRRAPGQGRAGLQEHVWRSTSTGGIS